MALTKQDLKEIEKLLDKKIKPLQKKIDSIDKRIALVEFKVDSVNKRLINVEKNTNDLKVWIPVDNTHALKPLKRESSPIVTMAAKSK